MIRGMRALLGMCVFVIAGLVALTSFSSNPQTTTALHSLVTQTHHQLNQLHKLKEELEGEQPLDNTILTELGFVENPFIFPNHSWSNISSPVIVSAINSRQLELAPELIKVAQILSLNASLVIYTLDLSEDEVKELENECNDTCVLIQFDFSLYPSHVRDFRLGAYRPIIIQEMVQRSGVVFWLDPCMRLLDQISSNLLPSDGSVLEHLVKRALSTGGVMSWPLVSPVPHLPTSALTHPDMFPAFRTYKHKYDFQQMSDPNAILIINTALIHRRLMRPWVSCSLTSACLSPIGAQDTGCKYNKKPLFRYSGCHLYDVSAFNVALGLAFGMDNDSYLDTSTKFVCVDSALGQPMTSLSMPSHSLTSMSLEASSGDVSKSLKRRNGLKEKLYQRRSVKFKSGKVLSGAAAEDGGNSFNGTVPLNVSNPVKEDASVIEGLKTNVNQSLDVGRRR